MGQQFWKYNPDPRVKHLIGKKVSVVDKNGDIRVGILNVAEVNPLHGHFQVTLGRTPIWPVDINTIKPYKDRKPLFKLKKK